MSEPLVVDTFGGVKRPSSVLLACAIVLGGVLMTGACLTALVSEDLDSNARITALFFAVFGVVVAGWGLRQFGPGASLGTRTPALRLDDVGIWIATGTPADQTAATVTWDEVTAVELRTVVVPGTLGRPGNVLRFVVPDHDAIDHDPFPRATLDRAAHLGVAPAAAALMVTEYAKAPGLVTLVLAWLELNKPALPIIDSRGER